MGREINRVPLDFDWPIGQTWLAFNVGVTFPPCPDCKVGVDERCPFCRDVRVASSRGYSKRWQEVYAELRAKTRPMPAGLHEWDFDVAATQIVKEEGSPVECARCGGHGDLATPELRAWAESMPATPLPTGEGWQLWETVGDSAMSPVFATDTELVDWMATNPWMMNPVMFAEPLLVPSTREVAEKFVRAGWSPSAVSVGGEFIDGVAYVVANEKDAPGGLARELGDMRWRSDSSLKEAIAEFDRLANERDRLVGQIVNGLDVSPEACVR